ncbi:uncharacterized protein [Antedon mediterranea]|uniref:uncharacterized protein n=1 Tax=Antedon mediterranea TaxID=105859 RepID=UPI003AF46370
MNMNRRKMISLWLCTSLFFFSSELCCSYAAQMTVPVAAMGNHQPVKITYSREELLQLRPNPNTDGPSNLNLNYNPKPRKRGRRGGIKGRLRRLNRLPLPTVIFGNAQSLCNKLDQLEACMALQDFRESSLLCFTETWFKDQHTTADVSIDGFSCVRGDRDLHVTGKDGGGGVCAYINTRWCNNIKVVKKHCCQDVEFIVIALRPFYLPREIPQIFVSVAYVQQEGSRIEAGKKIAQEMRLLESESTDALKLVLGDFNHFMLKRALPHWHQYVKVPTRKDSILDECYGNIPNAYLAKAKNGIGKSDHNLIQLLPKYKQKLRKFNIIKKPVKIWSEVAINDLKDCFDRTDWDTFKSDSLDDTVERCSAYIKFCEDSIVPIKFVKIYANNKPWVSKELRLLMKEKYEMFKQGDFEASKIRQIEK